MVGKQSTFFCGNSQRVKGFGCFRGRAPSLMFDRILNATLSEEKVSTTKVTQRDLELPLPPLFICFLLTLF